MIRRKGDDRLSMQLHRQWMALMASAVVALFVAAPAIQAVTIGASKDIELSENGGDNDGGDGIDTHFNVRWNNNDRNEWAAIQFDLTGYDKAAITDATLEVITYRDSNTSKNLRLFAHTVDWDETTTAFSNMPGLTWDNDPTTRGENLGVVTDLGAFNVVGTDTEGEALTVNPASLTAFINTMGAADLLTILITYESTSNGQWRIASREAVQTSSGVLTGEPGDLGPRLTFVPEPGSALLMAGIAATGVLVRMRRPGVG